VYKRATVLLFCLLAGTLAPPVAASSKLKVNPLPKEAGHQKVPIRVTLVLTDEFCSTVWQHKPTSENWPLGDTLCGYAEEVARGAFTGFVRTPKFKEIPEPETDAILVPKFVDASRAAGMTAWSESEVVLMLEWSAFDQSGKMAWAQTVRGTGRGKLRKRRLLAGALLVPPPIGRLNRETLQKALDELFLESFKQITSSPGMRRLATQQK
jgi:hypothetical protein